MSVPPIQMAALQWAGAAAGTLAEPWKVNALVSGRVLEYLSETQLIAEIQGVKVEALVSSPERVPRQFLARVRSGGHSPSLEILERPPDGTRVAAAVRERLPMQGGLAPLLADLRALVGSPAVHALPARVREALARLEASIADQRDVLDPDVLRDTMRRAGLQLEHAVRQLGAAPAGRAQTNPVDYDLKGALQRLVRVLLDTLPPGVPAAPSAPGEADVPPPLLQLPLHAQARMAALPTPDATVLASRILTHAQAALARIEIMQLQAHPSASPNACMLEIPVRGEDGFDVLQLRVDQDATGDADAAGAGAANWSLEFTLELPALGAVQGRIRLNGSKVGVDLWVDDDAAITALDDQTAVLPHILHVLGLQLVQMRTHRGMPLSRASVGRTLLDTSA